MNAINEELVQAAIQLLGNPATRDQQKEASMLALAGQPDLARRLMEVIPEAFGLILATHIAGGDRLQLPTTFSAMDAQQHWVEIPLQAEPLFALAVRAAQHIFHNGPRSTFQTVTDRSAIVATLNNALNAGGSLVGAKLGLSLLNIPAETYLTSPHAAHKEAHMTSTREKLVLAISLACAISAALIPLLTVPGFRSVFEAFHAELPLLTRLFVYYTHGLWLLAAAVLGVWLFWPKPEKRATAVVLIGVGGLALLTPLFICAMYLPIFNLGQ